jgi:hypothetical protein
MRWAIGTWLQQASTQARREPGPTLAGEGLAVGTIKNRMAELRWWTEKIGKQNVIARDNDHYGIGNRQYVTNGQQGAAS